jgi:hypothetical protein
MSLKNVIYQTLPLAMIIALNGFIYSIWPEAYALVIFRRVANLLSPPETGPVPPRVSWWRPALVQLFRFVLVGVLLGWLYAWGAPLIYQQKSTPGFWLGCAHGALMPMALPSLLLQKDVPIYATVNAGRIYKIGYIAGINGCGFVVFGLSFWKPQRRAKC